MVAEVLADPFSLSLQSSKVYLQVQKCYQFLNAICQKAVDLLDNLNFWWNVLGTIVGHQGSLLLEKNETKFTFENIFTSGWSRIIGLAMVAAFFVSMQNKGITSKFQFDFLMFNSQWVNPDTHNTETHEPLATDCKVCLWTWLKPFFCPTLLACAKICSTMMRPVWPYWRLSISHEQLRSWLALSSKVFGWSLLGVQFDWFRWLEGRFEEIVIWHQCVN